MYYLRNWKVDNGGIFLDEEIVLCESLDVEDEIGRELCQLEPLQEILLVGFILLKKIKRTVVKV